MQTGQNVTVTYTSQISQGVNRTVSDTYLAIR